jgi:NadR type nicotinamide-nucleotide adenylyltransferase
MRYPEGLVIGKFYPPHKGHNLLIRTAESYCDHVWVLVCDRPGEVPPATLRATWIREIHPHVSVIVVPDIVPSDDSLGWARYTEQILGFRPDAVFTSESYGDAYAAFLGSVHIRVDQERRNVPCSGTLIRSNPLDNLEYLEACVRAYFVKRICIVGAESSGTTTLARSLAEYYKTTWVPEYGREYSEEKLGRNEETWESDEFTRIATVQQQREDEAARTAHRLLLCDTDAFATSIWHERYMNYRSSTVERIADQRTYDLYLLTDIDIPFVQDGTRDGEHIRSWMHTRYKERLRETGRPFVLVRGTLSQRLATAIASIDPLLSPPKDLAD